MLKGNLKTNYHSSVLFLNAVLFINAHIYFVGSKMKNNRTTIFDKGKHITALGGSLGNIFILKHLLRNLD